jgi:archaetidylinositol phosphate synthase
MLKREKFLHLNVRIGIMFSKIPLSPNQWTLLSLLPALASFILLYFGYILPAAAVFFIAAFLDVIDGSVARVTGRVTAIGAYLDTVIDRVVEFLLIAGLFFVNYPPVFLPNALWLLLMLFGSFATTYIKAAASEKKIVKTELRGGILERGERLVMIVSIVAVTAFSPLWGMYLLIATTALTLITAIQRFLIGIKTFEENARKIGTVPEFY